MATQLKSISPSPIAMAIDELISLRDALADAFSPAGEQRIPVAIVLSETNDFTVTLRFVKVEARDLAMMKITHGMIPGYTFTDVTAAVDTRGLPGRGRLLVTAKVIA